MLNRITRFRGAVAAALLLLPVALVACGNDEQAASGGGGGGGMTVSIAEPATGANVSLPFKVKIDAGVPLGPTESGEHHVHLWFDDNAEDYLVVESNEAEVTSGLTATLSGKPMPLTAGEHTLHVSLRNANHSAAGAENQLKVTIGSGGAPAQTEPTQTAPAQTDDPYEY